MVSFVQNVHAHAVPEGANQIRRSIGKLRKTSDAAWLKIGKDGQVRVIVHVWTLLTVDGVAILALDRLPRNTATYLALHRLVKYAHKRVLGLRCILHGRYAAAMKLIFAAVCLNVLMFLAIYYLWL